MGRQVFTAGEILTAASMNDLGDATVMVFDDATARTTAIPTPVEGMVTYLKDTDRLEQFDGTNFVVAAPAQTGVLQVVSTSLTSRFTASVAAGAEVEITGLTATITPTSATSKVLVMCHLTSGTTVTAADPQFFTLFRGATKINTGDEASNRQRVTGGAVAGAFLQSSAMAFLDLPATTSAITYSVKLSHSSGSTDSVLLNGQFNNTNASNFARGASTITVMEVAG